MARKQGTHAVVLVLGDVGRSPRMQYHAVSLSKSRATNVTLVGYTGERCIEAVETSKRITIETFTPLLQWKKCPRAMFLLYAPIKVILQILQLFWILLFTIQSPDIFLVQNPPSIPTLFVVWIVCMLRSAKFIIDWHNLGFTVLSLSLGGNDQHFLVRFSKWYEGFFATKAHGHFCVTKAMRDWLKATWGIRAKVLYDKPPKFFCPTSSEKKHELFARVSTDFSDAASKFGDVFVEDTTLMTRRTVEKSGNVKIEERRDKPAMIISSTSWTVDEDFGILLDSLVALSERTCHMTASEFPNLVVVVTGKGPQKQYYLEKISKLALARIAVVTMWLEAEDYPTILGCADLGVCLHTSTSGLDLPMKVLDMFGCQVPVCAVNFKCLNELVHHKRNGMVFNDSAELGIQLYELLKGFPKNSKLKKLRSGLSDTQHWPENWRKCAAPVFRKLASEL